jgi:site-specific recombinase XerD
VSTSSHGWRRLGHQAQSVPGVQGCLLRSGRGGHPALRAVRQGGKPRKVFVCEECVAAVNDWAKETGRGEKGFGIVCASINRMVRRLCEDTGIEARYTPHQFRHAFALRLLRNGVNIRTIQKLLGHTDLNTTAKYLECGDEDLMAASEQAKPTKPKQIAPQGKVRSVRREMRRG